MEVAQPADPLLRIKIVLSHTSHPGNIGAAARAMKTMGLSRLVLVAPRHFPHEEATARASGAADILEQAQVCDKLSDALADCTLVAGMTARRRDLAVPFLWAREAAAELVQESRCLELAAGLQEPLQVALLFGNETAGLSNDELSHCQLGVTIPTNPEYSSLNLGAAVQLMAYELRLAAAQLAAVPPLLDSPRPASGEALERLYDHWQHVAIATGFLDPRQPKRLMQRLRRLFGRARLEHEEVSILRGFLSTVERPKSRG